jgi:hypothetical protein
VNADWRVTVRLDGKSRGSRAALQGQVADGLRARLGEFADVTADGYRLFVYTGTEALAGEAAQAALHLAGEYGLAPQIVLDRWNTDVSEWQSGGAEPLSGPERADRKHERQVAEDARRSEATGVPQWTVRVTLPSRDDAARLAGWLQSVGIPAVRRRKSVLLGAADEDVARELERLTAEQAPEAHVQVERNMGIIVQRDWAYRAI